METGPRMDRRRRGASALFAAALWVPLFAAAAIYLYDATLWRSLYFGPWTGPVECSLLALCAGAAAGALFRRARRRSWKDVRLPGVAGFWTLLAAAGIGAHALARKPVIFNIASIGFPPGLTVLLLLLPAGAAFGWFAFAAQGDRNTACTAGLAAVLLFAALYNVSVAKEIVGGPALGAPTWMAAAFGCAALAEVFSFRRNEARPLLGRAAALLLGAFLGVVLLSTIRSANPDRSLSLLARTAAGAALLLAGAAVTRRREGALRILLGLVGLCGLFGAVTFLLSFLFAVPYAPPSNILRSQVHLFHTHPNVSALLLGQASLAFLVLGITGRGRGKRAALYLGALLCAGVLAGTHSRAGILGFGTALLLFAGFGVIVPRLPLLLRRAAALLVPVLAALLLAGGLFGAQLMETFKGSLRVETLDFRKALWSAAYQAAMEHPLLGVGPGNYLAHARYISGRRTKLPSDTHAHSLSLHLAEGAGIPALLLASLLVLFFLRRAFREGTETGKDRAERLYLLACGSGAAGILVSNVFDLLPESVLPDVLWLYFGLIVGAGARAEKAGEGGDAPAAPSTAGRPAWTRFLPAAAILLALYPAATDHLLFRCAAETRPGPEHRLSILEQYRRLRPFDMRVPFQEGRLLLEAGRTPEALAAVEEAEPWNRYNAAYWDFRGRLLLEENRPGEADRAFTRAVKLDPFSGRAPEYLVDAARSALALEREEAAMAVMDRLFSLFPEEGINALRPFPDLVRALARAAGLPLSGNGKAEEALRLLARSRLDRIFQAPDAVPRDRTLDLGRYVSAATAYHVVGATEKGIALMRRCLERFPGGMPRLQVHLGWLLWQAGRAEEGLKELEKITGDARFGVRAADTIFEILEPTPRLPEAVKLVEEAAARPFDIHFKKRDNREAAVFLARGYFRLGNLEGAIRRARITWFFTEDGLLDPGTWLILARALRRTGRFQELAEDTARLALNAGLALDRDPRTGGELAAGVERFAAMAASLVRPKARAGGKGLTPEEVEAAARIMPDNPVRAVFLAFIERDLGRRAAARRRLEAARERFGALPFIEAAEGRIGP